MSAETWKAYRELQKNVNYLKKDLGEDGFRRLMDKVDQLKSEGVDVCTHLKKVLDKS